MLKRVIAGDLEVAYEEAGRADGAVVLLLHGFPYDVRAYDEVTSLLVSAGCRVIAPYLRGFGATRFLSASTLRSGQQAVLAHDLLAFMDALALSSAALAGYDWGGRAACIVAALWPQRVVGLVSVVGYNIQDIPGSAKPQAPENEFRFWYQYYFHSERGRAGLAQNRRQLCKLLWQLWSPNWRFDDATPKVEATECRLASQPRISVPTIAIDGTGDGVMPMGGSETHAPFFTGRYERRGIPSVGHNLPQEAPAEFAAAVLSLI